MKHFNTIEELHEEWKVNGACKEGREFNHSCQTLQEVFEKCPFHFRMWRLSKGYLQFAEHCQWDALDGFDLAHLLVYMPSLHIHCRNWDSISGHDWSMLLTAQPQFSVYCNWSKLHSVDWTNLLISIPSFIEFCDLEHHFTGYHSGSSIARIVAAHPHLHTKFNLATLNGHDWSLLLSMQPQFSSSEYCDWSKFSGNNWRDLLRIQPQFSIHCDWEKLDGLDWESLINLQKQFAKKCNWGLLSGNAIAHILARHPDLHDVCDLQKLSDANWHFLEIYRPEVAKLRPKNI